MSARAQLMPLCMSLGSFSGFRMVSSGSGSGRTNPRNLDQGWQFKIPEKHKGPRSASSPAPSQNKAGDKYKTGDKYRTGGKDKPDGKEDPDGKHKTKGRAYEPSSAATAPKPTAPTSFLDKLRAIKGTVGGDTVSSLWNDTVDLEPLASSTLSSSLGSSSAWAPPAPEAAQEGAPGGKAKGINRTKAAPHARPALSAQPVDPLAYVMSDAMYRSGAPSAWDPHEDYEMMGRRDEMSMFERAYRRGRLEKRQYISVIVDGDNLQFLPSLVHKGRKGGQEADTLIRRHVLKDVARSNLTLAGIDDVRISIFANYSGLTGVVAGYGSEAAERRSRWSEFVEGLTLQPGTIFVGVGKMAQAADLKVKAGLVQSVLDPNCVQSYLGGLDDFGYAVELTALRKLNLLQRVSLLNVPGVAGRSKYYADYAARQVKWAPKVFTGSNEAMHEYRALDRPVPKAKLNGNEQR